MRITMVGSGYVGLVTGACFAEFGFDVTCVDCDKRKIDMLNNGDIPIYEPGLESLVAQGRKRDRLHFTTDLKSAVANSSVVFIAVGTPPGENGHADLTAVIQAAKDIGKSITNYTVVVTKSTVPVGTSRKVSEAIKEANPNANFDVASNPEFLREGSAIGDFMRPDRVVIGTDAKAEQARQLLQKLYRPLYLIETPIVFTNIETSELIKYAANGFLATKIAFINEMADLCERAGADVQDLAKAIGLDGRIGRKFLHTGPGFGGSCFPKDTMALVQTAQQLNAPTGIIEAVVASNEKRKLGMADKICSAISTSLNQDIQNLKGKKLAILGITFKPNTDDIREAPSLTILPRLMEIGADLHAYDPAGMEGAQEHFKGITWHQNPYGTMKDADAVVILTEWNEFRALDFSKMHALLKTPLLIDFRNIYKSDEVIKSGFDYYSLGRPVYLKAAIEDFESISEVA